MFGRRETSENGGKCGAAGCPTKTPAQFALRILNGTPLLGHRGNGARRNKTREAEMTRTDKFAAGWSAMFVILGYAALTAAAFAQHYLVF